MKFLSGRDATGHAIYFSQITSFVTFKNFGNVDITVQTPQKSSCRTPSSLSAFAHGNLSHDRKHNSRNFCEGSNEDQLP